MFASHRAATDPDIQSILALSHTNWNYLYFVFWRGFVHVHLFGILLCTLIILETFVLTSLDLGVLYYINLLFKFISIISSFLLIACY